MTTTAPVLTNAIGGSGKIYIKGYGATPGWRVDAHKEGSGELLGAGPVDGNGNFEFEANYAILRNLIGDFNVQVRQTDNTSYSYWSQSTPVRVT